jgi:parvulin-like peptidyl-prolyl isomerase
MAMMAKMRSLAPAFILTVGGLFVLFMVITDSNVLQAIGGKRANVVGTVNGQEISYQEFQAELDRQLEAQKKQTGQDLDENQTDQIREQVWDALVTQKIISGLIKDYGIKVSDQEVRDIILGDNPPDFLKKNFIDSTGNFNRKIYEDALFDPRNKQALVQAEDIVRQSRLTQKLQSMILASVTVGEDEVKRKFVEQNTNINAEYALVDLTQVPDSAIKVTDSDLRAYYDKNIELYKVPPQRKLKFVLFKNVASAEDTQMVVNNLNNVKKSMSEGDTLGFAQLVKIYSERPFSRDTLTVQALTPEVIAAFNKAKPESILGPFMTPQGCILYNYLGSVQSKDEFVRASHILINQFGSDEKNLAEANKIFDSLKAGKDFATLAKEYSQDPGSASKGGDLGYFGKGMMVKEFEEASLKGKVGEIQKPIKTNFGYHIIKVTDRTNKKYVVEEIVNQIKQTASSRDRNFNNANDFSYLAKKNDFDQEANLMKYQIQETPLFVENAAAIPSIGRSERLLKFAFSNSVNTISDPFKVPNGFVVVKIIESTNEGYRPFDELKEQLKPIVTREMKFEKIKVIADNIYKKINGDLGKVTSVNPRINVVQTGNFTPSGFIPAIGRDYAFVDAAMSLQLNKVSEPLKGIRGYYLIKVISRTSFDQKAFEEKSNEIRNQLLQQKRNTFLNQWIADIKKSADIVDHRYMFFGQ